MKIIKGQKINLQKADILIVPFFESKDFSAIVACCPEIEIFVQKYKFTGKIGNEIAFYSSDMQKIVIVLGAGKGKNITDAIKLAKSIISAIKQKYAKKIVIHFMQKLIDFGVTSIYWKYFLDYLYINNYSFDRYKKKNDAKEKPEKLFLFIDDRNAAGLLSPSLIKESELLAVNVDKVRDLVNETPVKVNPDTLVDEFIRTAKDSELDIMVLRENELTASQLNGILAVGQASPFESALVRVSYFPSKSYKSIALVGKGVTFDSGGLNLKSRTGMVDMKCDMSGAAVIIGVVDAISKLQIPVIVDAYAPIAENMTGDYAYKPGEILTFKNEKTVEIVDTDCEGRLMLADALTMAQEDKPDCIIELSTLTGAIASALGDSYAGVMGNDDYLVSLLLEAGKNTGERLCRLPLPEEYKESIHSKVADLKNGGFGSASAIKAGLFLNEFTGDIPFIHIDMGSTAYLSKPNTFYAKEGATGYGVRLIVEFLKLWLKKKK